LGDPARGVGGEKTMLKNALIFAGAGVVAVLAAPSFLPALDAHFAPPSTPPSYSQPEAVATAAATPDKVAGFRELEIPADSRGQYFVDGYVDGEPIKFLVDTGASFVSISPELANRLGLFETASSPHYRLQTANGSTIGYGVTLKNIDLGSIYVADVPAVVNGAMGGVNLLGANFLQKLASVEQRNGELVLRQ
jgi:aspartyl protease family protein